MIFQQACALLWNKSFLWTSLIKLTFQTKSSFSNLVKFRQKWWYFLFLSFFSFFKYKLLPIFWRNKVTLKSKLALLGQFLADFKRIPQDILRFHFFRIKYQFDLSRFFRPKSLIFFPIKTTVSLKRLLFEFLFAILSKFWGSFSWTFNWIIANKQMNYNN